MGKKVKILVACHKSDKVFQNDVYIPIHVGKAISKCQMDMVGDDSGDNISEKNPMYCELTAQYWAWKNLNDVEYVGLCHYRRYFETQVTDDNIDNLLGTNCDIILASPLIERGCMGVRLQKATCMEDVYILMNVLKKEFPDFYLTAERFLNGNRCVPYNMFVMRKELFNSFAYWQFRILEEMEKKVHLSGYTRMRRIYGYMAEMLLPIWCEHNKLHVRYDNIVPKLNDKAIKSWKNPLRNIYNRFVFFLLKERLDLNIEAVKVGLRNDGIIK